MTVDLTRAVGPADVVVLRGVSWTAKLIGIGSVWRGLDPASHVAVVHHQDLAGRWWGIEGRPGGVGWVDMTRYLRDPKALCNHAQPKTAAARADVSALMVKLLGTDYDWAEGIARDAFLDLDMPGQWRRSDPVTGLLPAHVVCSSLAAYGYDRTGLPAPHRPGEGVAQWRDVEPSDWRAWTESAGWTG